MDEVHVKEELVYMVNMKDVVNLSDTNNQLLEFEVAVSQDKSSPSLASGSNGQTAFSELEPSLCLSGDHLFDPV